jgi:glutamine synthetase
MPGRDKAVRAELRCPDPSANPYLAIAAMLAAGLDGIDSNIDCPAPLNNVNVYHLTPEERVERGIASLPGSLSEAMRELDKDSIIKDALGNEIYAAFERAKWTEIDEHRTRVSDWEIERYLETA